VSRELLQQERGGVQALGRAMWTVLQGPEIAAAARMAVRPLLRATCDLSRLPMPGLFESSPQPVSRGNLGA
jgi:hypothetical protein